MKRQVGFSKRSFWAEIGESTKHRGGNMSQEHVQGPPQGCRWLDRSEGGSEQGWALRSCGALRGIQSHGVLLWVRAHGHSTALGAQKPCVKWMLSHIPEAGIGVKISGSSLWATQHSVLAVLCWVGKGATARQSVKVFVGPNLPF